MSFCQFIAIYFGVHCLSRHSCTCSVHRWWRYCHTWRLCKVKGQRSRPL